MTDRLASEATLLDLAMREHLALRDEMNDMRRQAATVITSALVAGSAATAAVGAGVLGVDPGVRGLLLLAIAALVDVVSLWTLAILNACKILELQIDRTAEAIRTIALAGAAETADPFLSYQGYVRDFTGRAMRAESKGALVAWLYSYGLFGVMAGLLVAFILGLMVVGGWQVLTQSPDYSLPQSPDYRLLGALMLGLDLILTAGVGVGSIVQNLPEDKWKRFFYGPL